MHGLNRVSRVINNIADFLGRGVSYALIVMMCIATMEVVLRYVFNRPTNWAWDVNVQLFALVSAIAAAYSFHHGYFVNVDTFYKNFSPRRKLIADVLAFAFAATFCVILVWLGFEAFWRSWTIRETYPSYFAPPAYPVKFLIPLGGALVLLQAVAKLISNFMPPPGEATREDN